MTAAGFRRITVVPNYRLGGVVTATLTTVADHHRNADERNPSGKRIGRRHCSNRSVDKEAPPCVEGAERESRAEGQTRSAVTSGCTPRRRADPEHDSSPLTSSYTTRTPWRRFASKPSSANGEGVVHAFG